MAQISRAYKFQVPVLIRVFYRNCCYERRRSNYYDVLHISPNASQQEIRHAYINLSKQLHPDCGMTGSHEKFVKINEAYNVLSNIQNRRNYDYSLKYNNNHGHNFSQDTGYDSYYRYAYDMYYTGYEKTPTREEKKRAVIVVVVIIAIGSIIEMLRLKIWLDRRHEAYKKNIKMHQEYEEYLMQFKNQTLEERLQHFDKLFQEYKSFYDK